MHVMLLLKRRWAVHAISWCTCVYSVLKPANYCSIVLDDVAAGVCCCGPAGTLRSGSVCYKDEKQSYSFLWRRITCFHKYMYFDMCIAQPTSTLRKKVLGCRTVLYLRKHNVCVKDCAFCSNVICIVCSWCFDVFSFHYGLGWKIMWVVTCEEEKIIEILLRYVMSASRC
jgi:hypothetical protein